MAKYPEYCVGQAAEYLTEWENLIYDGRIYWTYCILNFVVMIIKL